MLRLVQQPPDLPSPGLLFAQQPGIVLKSSPGHLAPRLHLPAALPSLRGVCSLHLCFFGKNKPPNRSSEPFAPLLRRGCRGHTSAADFSVRLAQSFQAGQVRFAQKCFPQIRELSRGALEEETFPWLYLRRGCPFCPQLGRDGHSVTIGQLRAHACGNRLPAPATPHPRLSPPGAFSHFSSPFPFKKTKPVLILWARQN